VGLALWDTLDGEEHDRLRPLAYMKAHIILLCYAVNDEQSLHNAQEKVLYDYFLCYHLRVIEH
jgi:GTPase SAR1 family protein